jgi:hypothetical protein
VRESVGALGAAAESTTPRAIRIWQWNVRQIVVMRRRDVWRSQLRARGGPGNGLWRRHHLSVQEAVTGVLVAGVTTAGEHLATSSSRVRVVVYPRVPCQLVGAAEALRASGIGAGVWLLAGVGPDMAGLMLQSVEGLLANGALVRPGHVLARLF